jgi:hypothetical protein
MFVDYAARGRAFKAAVERLARLSRSTGRASSQEHVQAASEDPG